MPSFRRNERMSDTQKLVPAERMPSFRRNERMSDTQKLVPAERMHFNNYISMKDAMACISKNIKQISATPTALRQSPKPTIEFLIKNGIKVQRAGIKGRPSKLTEAQVKRILAIRQTRLSFYKIANITGIPKSTVFDYYNRYKNRQLCEEELIKIQVGEAHNVFKDLLKKNLDEEITELAKRGLATEDIEELTEVMRKIEDIVQFRVM